MGAVVFTADRPRPLRPDFVMPADKTTDKALASGVMAPLARIKSGVSFRDVQNEMSTQMGAAVERYPQFATTAAVKLSLMRDYMYGGQGRIFAYLACATVMILFAQNLILAVAALPAGFAIATLICYYVRQEAPRVTATHILPQISLRIVFFGVLLAAFVAVFVSLVTTPRVLKVANEEQLLRGVQSQDRGRPVWQGALVAVQVCLVLAVLIGASLLLNSVVRLMQLPLGVDAERVLVFSPRLPYVRYSGEQAKDFWERLVVGVKNHPDVKAAASTLQLPMTENTPWASLIGTGEDWDAVGGMLPVSRQYFETLRIPLKDGRTFSAEEDRANAPVGVINETAVQLLWPDGQAIGRTVRSPWFPRPFTVIGIVGDTRFTPDRAVMPMMYVPAWDAPCASAPTGDSRQ